MKKKIIFYMYLLQTPFYCLSTHNPLTWIAKKIKKKPKTALDLMKSGAVLLDPSRSKIGFYSMIRQAVTQNLESNLRKVWIPFSQQIQSALHDIPDDQIPTLKALCMNYLAHNTDAFLPQKINGLTLPDDLQREYVEQLLQTQTLEDQKRFVKACADTPGVRSFILDVYVENHFNSFKKIAYFKTDAPDDNQALADVGLITQLEPKLRPIVKKKLKKQLGI